MCQGRTGLRGVFCGWVLGRRSPGLCSAAPLVALDPPSFRLAAGHIAVESTGDPYAIFQPSDHLLWCWLGVTVTPCVSEQSCALEDVWWLTCWEWVTTTSFSSTTGGLEPTDSGLAAGHMNCLHHQGLNPIFHPFGGMGSWRCHVCPDRTVLHTGHRV